MPLSSQGSLVHIKIGQLECSVCRSLGGCAEHGRSNNEPGADKRRCVGHTRQPRWLRHYTDTQTRFPNHTMHSLGVMFLILKECWPLLPPRKIGRCRPASGYLTILRRAFMIASVDTIHSLSHLQDLVCQILRYI